MGKQQKKWTAEFKTEVVMAVLHGEVAAAEIARQHGIHETLVYKWKRQFLEAGSRVSRISGRRTPKSYSARKRWNVSRRSWVRRWSSWTWQKKRAVSEYGGAGRTPQNAP